MSATTFYRIAVWLPLVLPGAVAVIVHGLGAGPGELGILSGVVQILLMSLAYGGIPYALLALWATWWIGGRSEARIRRLALWSPVLMAALYVVMSLVFGVVVGEPRMGAGLATLGGACSLVLGYFYVGGILLVRLSLQRWVGPSRDARESVAPNVRHPSA